MAFGGGAPVASLPVPTVFVYVCVVARCVTVMDLSFSNSRSLPGALITIAPQLRDLCVKLAKAIVTVAVERPSRNV